MNREIPGSIQKRRIGLVGDHCAGLVQDQQRALLDGVGSSVGRGQVADYHESMPQHTEPGGESQHGFALEKDRQSASRRDLDDRRSGALQVRAVVEIRNQNVVWVERPALRKTIGNER